MINDIPDLDTFEPALRELKKAAEECRRMANVGVGSFSEYDDAWRAVLIHVDRAWKKLQAAARNLPGWPPIESRCRLLRKKDPLLLYVRQARNIEEHTIAPIAKDWDPEAKIIGSILSFRPWSRSLLPVTNRGKTFQPPKKHLGGTLENASPLDVANAAITFYCKLYNDVLTKVYGVVPEGTEEIWLDKTPVPSCISSNQVMNQTGKTMRFYVEAALAWKSCGSLVIPKRYDFG